MIIAQAYARLEVLKDLSRMELLHLRVVTHARGHDLPSFKLRQILLDVLVAAAWPVLGLLGGSVTLGLNAHHFHAAEEDLEDGLHIVDQHTLKVALLESRLLDLLLRNGPGERRVRLLAILVPHLKNNYFLDVPVLAFAFEVLHGSKLFVKNHP